MSSNLISGSSLGPRAKEVIVQAKQIRDEVLTSRTPPTGDIVVSLLKYYQLKFMYLVLLGKPTPGAVINKGMSEVLLMEDTAAGKLERYREIRRNLLLKTSTSPMALHDELTRQASKTTIGQAWWSEVDTFLRRSEEMQVVMGMGWVLTYEAIQMAVEGTAPGGH